MGSQGLPLHPTDAGQCPRGCARPRVLEASDSLQRICLGVGEAHLRLTLLRETVQIRFPHKEERREARG